MKEGKRMRPTKQSGEILKKYVQLARKLGKFPTLMQLQKFGVSERQIRTHFESTKKLKELALSTHPELQNIIIPLELSVDDINLFKFHGEKGKVQKHNKNLVKDVTTLDYISKFAESVFSGR